MSFHSEFIDFVSKIDLNKISDAPSLRNASDKIIGKWIELKFQYPDDLIDRFVYIESSIEDTMFEDYKNQAEQDREYRDAFNFHYPRFVEAMKDVVKRAKGGSAQ